MTGLPTVIERKRNIVKIETIIENTFTFTSECSSSKKTTSNFPLHDLR